METGRLNRYWRRGWWIAGAMMATLGLIAATLRTRPLNSRSEVILAAEPRVSAATRVETVYPSAGGFIRKTVQPGSAHSFESAELYAKVSGFLKSQHVDIGSVVKRGDLLAEIDVPELAQQLDRDKAQLRQSEADVALAQAQIGTAVAEQKAAEAYVTQTEASVQRSKSEHEFHDKQYQRMRELHQLNSVEKRVVDEQLNQLQGAEAGELTARSAVATAKAQADTAVAKVARAESELLVAKAKLDVMRAELARTATLLSYTQITSPYDGLVTQRNFHRGAFIRAADQGGEVPLFRVDRTDLMRIVVQVPERDVPYTQAGDRARLVFDALPGKPFNGEVVRVAGSEDSQSRSMRVEIDMPNESGIIRNGMYGQAEIELEPASQGVTIPSGCVVGNVNDNRAHLFVVDRSKARLIEVKVGTDTGTRIEVNSGLTPSAQVIVKPPSALTDGSLVEAVAAPPETRPSH